jgi:hypothetical protein
MKNDVVGYPVDAPLRTEDRPCFFQPRLCSVRTVTGIGRSVIGSLLAFHQDR